MTPFYWHFTFAIHLLLIVIFILCSHLYHLVIKNFTSTRLTASDKGPLYRLWSPTHGNNTHIDCVWDWTLFLKACSPILSHWAITLELHYLMYFLSVILNPARTLVLPPTLPLTTQPSFIFPCLSRRCPYINILSSLLLICTFLSLLPNTYSLFHLNTSLFSFTHMLTHSLSFIHPAVYDRSIDNNGSGVGFHTCIHKLISPRVNPEL